MRALIQRVLESKVEVDDKTVGSINLGLMVLLGIESTDSEEDVVWLVNKIVQLRIFDDVQGIMNLSLLDLKGEILVISQFTLHASTKKGNRPSYIKAANPSIAKPLYELFLKKLKEKDIANVAQGIFGADMKVQLVNDGPVTIFIDTKNRE
ncbi:MAG: D-tyrosyl-tRNA(Tyr) deacylase [Saprospiraceae bacterium]|jgi:D-tyrosyl-tRNA(Tyr) deacylase|nr:D-tyrosyl-tRNA(Tyr) deacylase [Saprospiraceae bacterium]MBL0292886.1 D-tyrosyl-tRNA(Tyr) deacylase [Saprospiraceae bacterium]